MRLARKSRVMARALLEINGEEWLTGTPRFRVLARESRGQYPKAGTQIIKIGQNWPQTVTTACQNWPPKPAGRRSMPHRVGGQLICCACRVVYAGTPCREPRCNVNLLGRDQLFDVVPAGVVGQGGRSCFRRARRARGPGAHGRRRSQRYFIVRIFVRALGPGCAANLTSCSVLRGAWALCAAHLLSAGQPHTYSYYEIPLGPAAVGAAHLTVF